jgi:hypothetical protein
VAGDHENRPPADDPTSALAAAKGSDFFTMAGTAWLEASGRVDRHTRVGLVQDEHSTAAIAIHAQWPWQSRARFPQRDRSQLLTRTQTRVSNPQNGNKP